MPNTLIRNLGMTDISDKMEQSFNSRLAVFLTTHLTGDPGDPGDDDDPGDAGDAWHHWHHFGTTLGTTGQLVITTPHPAPRTDLHCPGHRLMGPGRADHSR